jgi:hypothetical protein
VQLLGKVVRARRGLLRRGRDGWADGFLRRQRHGEGEWVLQEAGWLSRLPADFRMAWLARAKPFTVLRDEIIYR